MKERVKTLAKINSAKIHINISFDLIENFMELMELFFPEFDKEPEMSLIWSKRIFSGTLEFDNSSVCRIFCDLYLQNWTKGE